MDSEIRKKMAQERLLRNMQQFSYSAKLDLGDLSDDEFFDMG